MTWNYCNVCEKKKTMKLVKKCEECGATIWQCPDCGNLDAEISEKTILEHSSQIAHEMTTKEEINNEHIVEEINPKS